MRWTGPRGRQHIDDETHGHRVMLLRRLDCTTQFATPAVPRGVRTRLASSQRHKR